MEAYFFGPTGDQLFGIFHEADGGNGHGVVLACPGPQEYMQSHYAFRLLAAQLAREGCSVLRFDWRGTGDSAGDSDSVSFQHWRDDLQIAVQELNDVASPRRMSIVGFRLGATIAASTPLQQPLEELVLWEPVIHGHPYVAALRARERRKSGDLLQPPPGWATSCAHGLLGHAVSGAHLAEMEALDLTRQAVVSARRTSVITHTVTAPQQLLIESLRARGLQAELTVVEDAGAHLRDDGMLLAGATIAYITDKIKAV